MKDRRPISTDKLRAHTREEDQEEAESLSLVFLLALEQLSPAERMVFLLHDFFGRGQAEVAGVIGESEQACQQQLLRSRNAMRATKRSIEASRRRRNETAARFVACINDEHVASVTESLAPDAVAYLDGDAGQDAPAEPVVGRHAVIDALSRTLRLAGITAQLDRLGRRPRAILRDRESRLVGTVSLEITDGLVQTIRCVLHP